jgi:hypothetical protein
MQGCVRKRNSSTEGERKRSYLGWCQEKKRDCNEARNKNMSGASKGKCERGN